ncbi:hypothetical protein, partial [Streptomyces clavuligerus]|uniref:hypothetical protein n=1 Tax=Streptomyces clavuligerus TaxID=1901 RepID=UPI0018D091BA
MLDGSEFVGGEADAADVVALDGLAQARTLTTYGRQLGFSSWLRSAPGPNLTSSRHPLVPGGFPRPVRGGGKLVRNASAARG